MIGVDDTSIGGMLSVSNQFKSSVLYNENVELFYIPTATRKNVFIKILFFFKALVNICWCLKRNNIDIVHIHMAEKTSVSRKAIVMSLAKKYGCKIVVQLHAGPFMKWYDSLTDKKKKAIRKVVNMPDKLLVLGNYWYDQLLKIVDEKKLGVLYNGVIVPQSNPYNPNAKNITFFGHLKKEKGIYDLLIAIEQIKEKLPEDTKLNLCGTSDEFDINHYINEHKLSEVVNYCGWINGIKKEDILKNTAISVLPTYIEGLSMTVLEGMAYGIPIVTTNVTTMPEMLGGIVDLIEPGSIDSLSSGIIDLLFNKQKRIVISHEEFERANSTFGVEKIIEQTLRIYKGIQIGD